MVHGLTSLYQVTVAQRPYNLYVYARPDMQWLVEPHLLWLHARADTASRAQPTRSSLLPAAYVFDTESYWGVNDRFAILNVARAAAAYFVHRASLLPTHEGNTETLLAAALKANGVAIRWMPTLGTLPCCASPSACHARGSSGLCQRIWVNDVEGYGPRGRVLSVKYVYEAQAAVQNAEVLLRNLSSLVSCPADGNAPSAAITNTCQPPANPRSPHACVPIKALWLSPVAPHIAWRALWQRNSSSWYRWIDAAPWR